MDWIQIRSDLDFIYLRHIYKHTRVVTVVCDCICGINMHAASEILLGSVMESEFGSLVFRGQKLIREVHKSLE